MYSTRSFRKLIVCMSCPLQGLGGVSLKVCGKTQISVAGIPSPLDVVVCDTLPHDMILGDTSQHTKSGYASIGPIAPETGHSKINHLIRQNADCFSARNGTCFTDQNSWPTHMPESISHAFNQTCNC